MKPLCLVWLCLLLGGCQSEGVSIRKRSVDTERLDPESEIDELKAAHQAGAHPHGGQLETNVVKSGTHGTQHNRNLPPDTGEPPGGSSVSETNLQQNDTQAVPHTAPHQSQPVEAYLITGPVFIAVVAGCSVAGLIGLVVAGVCWYRLQKNVKAASDVDYPAYGETGPTKDGLGSPGDRKLAQSAQMYHYQHQKQQMIAMEKAQGDMQKDGSDEESEEENEEGDYTVFECPGLAPTGEMEVKNPLFSDTPVTPSNGQNGAAPSK